MTTATSLALALGLLATLGVTAAQGAAQQVTSSRPGTLRVSATGEARTRPDLAMADFGVETVAPTAREAGEENARTMERVIAALVRAGVARADIETRDYTVFPDYRPGPRPDAEPQIAGYRVANTVTARTTDLSRLGAVMDAALEAGANRVHSVRFGLREPERARAEALRDAVRKARAEAELLAQAMGVTIQRLAEVSTASEAPRPPFPVMETMDMAARAADTPISPREQRVVATVTVVYEVSQGAQE